MVDLPVVGSPCQSPEFLQPPFLGRPAAVRCSPGEKAYSTSHRGAQMGGVGEAAQGQSSCRMQTAGTMAVADMVVACARHVHVLALVVRRRERRQRRKHVGRDRDEAACGGRVCRRWRRLIIGPGGSVSNCRMTMARVSRWHFNSWTITLKRELGYVVTLHCNRSWFFTRPSFCSQAGSCRMRTICPPY
jgi:hypothetical protein